MLPEKLYEMLPYLYILTGIISASVVDSLIVRISSILLIMAGVFVFIMRRNYRKSIKNRLDIDRMMTANMPDADVRRSGIERRCRTASEWPISDASGDIILYERRSGERRMSRRY